MPSKGSARKKSDEPTDPISSHLCKRLKQRRADRGWSLDAMAQASGVSRSMLSQIERGQANPTVAVTFRIARALGISMAEPLDAPDTSANLTVIRADDHAYQYRSDEHCTIRTLSPLNLEKDVEFYQVQLAEAGELRSAAHFRGTREFLVVQKGRVRVESGSHHEELAPGDSATFRADLPHAIVNVGRGPAVMFLVDIYRPG